MVSRSSVFAILMASIMVISALMAIPIQTSDGAREYDDDTFVCDGKVYRYDSTVEKAVWFEGMENYESKPDTLNIPDEVSNGTTGDYKVIGIKAYSIPCSVVTLTLGKYVSDIEKPCYDPDPDEGDCCLSKIIVDPENHVYEVEDDVLIREGLPYVVMYPPAKTDTEFDPVSKYISYDAYAFAHAKYLKKITLNGQNAILRQGVFANCTSLCEIVSDGVVNKLSKSLVVIDKDAFHCCTSLTSLTMEDDLTLIGEMAFEKCTSLKSIHLGSNFSNLGYRAFEGCSSLKDITVSEDNYVFQVDDDGEYKGILKRRVAFSSQVYIALYPGGNDRTVLTLGNDIKGIDSFAFSFGNGNLKEVYYNIDEGDVSPGAFYGCKSLEKVHLNKDVYVIGENAFLGCESLSEVTDTAALLSINNGAFTGCKSLVSFTMPEGLTYIGDSSFSDSGVQNVHIPDTVKEIGTMAFDGSSLKEITIDGHPIIGDWAFSIKGDLTVNKHSDFTIPEGAFGPETNVTLVNMDEWHFPWYNVVGIIICLIILAGMIYLFRKI